jgi:predicted metal-dependent enzyme (double-stranded beta helix superfamily)
MSQELSPELRREVAITIAEVKRLAEDGVTRPVLGAIMRELEKLGEKTALFPRALFPPPDGPTNVLYTIASDPDGRYTLYVSVANKGKNTPPHNHATWAAIVAIEGDERNKLYRRVNGGRPCHAVTLEQWSEHVVRPGQPIALMPEDIHSIHIESEMPARHLHLYGRRLQDLKARLQFDPASGEATHYPPNPNIR